MLPWIGIVGTLVGAVVGFGLGRWGLARDRRRRLKGNREALRAEVDLCAEFAERYLADKVLAPLYRLPSSAFEKAFPNLLADAALSRSQVAALASFWGLVGEINRGLDQTHDARDGDQNRLGEEVNRLTAKCRKLLGKQEGVPSYVERARCALSEIEG